MQRLRGTAGGVRTRSRGLDKDLIKLIPVGVGPYFVLPLFLAALPTTSAQAATFIQTDVLSSVGGKSDVNGNVIERITYAPYGAVVGVAVADGPGCTWHVSDSATALSYMRQLGKPLPSTFSQVCQRSRSLRPLVAHSRHL